MALTPSATLMSDFQLPNFSLSDVSTNRTIKNTDFSSAKVVVVIFLCRHCPYVVHVLPTLLEIARQKSPEGVSFVGISANDAEKYPDDAPDKLAQMVAEKGILFPILYDESQSVARSFHASCTPEFFVFDQDRQLFYHGRMDASTPGNKLPCNGEDLLSAINAALCGMNAPEVQHPSMGCGIKWKP
jgi:thiol-disulfide isomerase/thioredoxin